MIATPFASAVVVLPGRVAGIVVGHQIFQAEALMAQAAETIVARRGHLESAIAATLAPGAYTALLSGVNNGTGLGLVEVVVRLSLLRRLGLVLNWGMAAFVAGPAIRKTMAAPGDAPIWMSEAASGIEAVEQT